MIDKAHKIRTVRAEIASTQPLLRKEKSVKINVEAMRRAFQEVDSYAFYFDSLRPRDTYIEDIQDIFELTALIERTVELQDRITAMETRRIRVKAFLGKNPTLEECIKLYSVLPEGCNEEVFVGVRIVKLLREKIAEFPDFKSAYAAFRQQCGEMRFFHATFMRLLGEKFFPAA